MKKPIAIMKYGQIKNYLTDDFFRQYEVWRNSHYTRSLPLDPVWGKNPKYLIDIITAFEEAFDGIRG